MRTKIGASLVSLLMLVPFLGFAGCQSSGDVRFDQSIQQMPKTDATLTGTVAYRQRVALPADATLTVMISDVSRMDAAAPAIALTQIATAGRQVPIPFSLNYLSSRLTPNGRYAVSARIRDSAGQLLWTTDTHVDLPPPGQSIELLLVPTS